jgi:glycosyltransferase involved in cell wall biosynthesis
VDQPRTLIVTGNNFNLINGGGITLTNLFKGWPSDRLANVHNDSTPEDHSTCRTFYRLSSDEIRWMWPFSFAQAWYERGKNIEREVVTGSSDASGRQNHMAARPWLNPVRRIVGDAIPKHVRLSGALLQWVHDFRPRLLYGFLGSLDQMSLIRSLARHFRIPMAIHMMDDWPSVLYSRGLLKPFARPMAEEQLRLTLAEAAVRMGICEEMCQEYQRRYGHAFVPFQNTLDLQQWVPFSRTQWSSGNPFVVRYAGSIVADGQRQSLLDICIAVDQLALSGQKIQMWIHSPSQETAYLRSQRFDSSCINIVGPPNPAEIAALLAQADVLVLPYNFDVRSEKYVRLSLPTKAPAYMISGTPILVYAPDTLATARYAMREQWGLVVATQGINGLQAALRSLMEDEPCRRRFGERAQQVARARHDAAVVRPAFWRTLSEAAEVPYIAGVFC